MTEITLKSLTTWLSKWEVNKDDRNRPATVNGESLGHLNPQKTADT